MELNFKVIYSPRSQNDLNNIYDYILSNFKSSETAVKQIERISKSIHSLSVFPKRHSIYKRDFSKMRGFRFFPVDNYVIFYEVIDAKQTVNISRILYKGSLSD